MQCPAPIVILDDHTAAALQSATGCDPSVACELTITGYEVHVGPPLTVTVTGSLCTAADDAAKDPPAKDPPMPPMVPVPPEPSATPPMTGMVGGPRAPVNLTVQGFWDGGGGDRLAWGERPGCTYTVRAYDVVLATGLTEPSFTVTPALWVYGPTYTVTATDAAGRESPRSAKSNTQGAADPSLAPSWQPPVPPALAAPVVTPEWNAGSPRNHGSWAGNDAADTYSVYRDGDLLFAGLWGTNFYDEAALPGSTHSYAVAGCNVAWKTPQEGPQSAATPCTALTASPAPAVPGVVQALPAVPNDDSILFPFVPFPGAADHRAYVATDPGVVKYAGGAGRIEMNGLDPSGPVTVVIEAVDKPGPFCPAPLVAGGMPMGEIVNGQGDPSNVPIVLAASAPVSASCAPRGLTGRQAFFETFRDFAPLLPLPMPAQIDPYDNYGQRGCYWAKANDDWEVRNYAGDTLNTTCAAMASHFMFDLYDGGTPPGGPMHNNDASLVLLRRKAVTLAAGDVLHWTFEADTPHNGRRWLDALVFPAGEVLRNPGAKAGAIATLSGDAPAFRWRIQQGAHLPEIVTAGDPASPQTTESYLTPQTGQAWDVAKTSARACPYGVPTDPTDLVYSLRNGGMGDLDRRRRFDLYLSLTRFRILEDGVLAWEADLPAAQALLAGDYSLALVWQLYHTGNDRPEDINAGPGEAYWANHTPFSDKRHCDNVGAEVLDSFPASF